MSLSTNSDTGAPPVNVVRGLAIFLSVYLMAVFHRTSLGVAGLEAKDRFGISPGQLSVFIFVQIGVYAAMQIPAGILVDRFGPRRLLFASAAIMGIAQLAFALVPTYGGALVARGILGCGDALTFVSVLRFAADYVSPKRYPLVVAITAMLGSIGNVVATVPLTLALHNLGWTPTFASAAGLSLADAVLVWFLAPRAQAMDSLRRSRAQVRAGLVRVGHSVASAWRVPGTKLGFWIHFSNTCTMAFLTVLWGQPYLIEAQGMTREAASSVLSLMIVVQVITSLMLGTVISKRPGVRTPIGVGVAVAIVASWTALLLLGGDHAPDVIVIVVFIISALGGPASMIGFAVARDYNDSAVMGTATGIINVAGWSACVVACVAVGRVLDIMGTAPADYRTGFLVAMCVPALGLIQVARWWRRTRHASLTALARGETVPVHVNARRWDLPVDVHVDVPATDRTL
jgi:MFS family permease